jgi:hypothetical protein
MLVAPPDEPLIGLNLFLMLVMGHWVGDFGLQSDRMAVEKCPGHDVTLPWHWWLGAHAGIHGFLVGAITGIPLLGLAEWAMHSLIDFGKCQGFYGLPGDQALHLSCKLVWTLVATALAARI